MAPKTLREIEACMSAEDRALLHRFDLLREPEPFSITKYIEGKLTIARLLQACEDLATLTSLGGHSDADARHEDHSSCAQDSTDQESATSQ